MVDTEAGRAYHIERATAARLGISRYACGCQRCHGLKTQMSEVVESHHRKHGRDSHIWHSLLRGWQNMSGEADDVLGRSTALDNTNEYNDDEEQEDVDGTIPIHDVNYQAMVENFFSRADEIHDNRSEEEDSVVDFGDLSSCEDDEDHTEVMELLQRQSNEPLYPGASTNCLQFSTILMSICTLFGVGHHCLDELLTFLKQDVLPPNNKCPKSSYKMKALLLKLSLSHETIHCCDCGKTLYWKDNALAQQWPHCSKCRYISGSLIVPIRVLRYFSIIKKLRRLYRCPEIARHMTWHVHNHSQDRKMRLAVDSEQWNFVDRRYPSFSSEARNVRIGLSLDGVNPYSLQTAKHSVWLVLTVFYNLPPYLVTKKFFISLTMLIPGPNSPSDDTIDIYLQPLLLDLKKLWIGVSAVDMSKAEDDIRNFKMRGMLLWTVNDFPAYTLIFGQTGKGYCMCPVCGGGTCGEYSAAAEKMVILGHRKWLSPNHDWRSAMAAFNGKQEHGTTPNRQSGVQIAQHGAQRQCFLRDGGRPNSENDPVKRTGVKRVSIFYDLPYWSVSPCHACGSITHLGDSLTSKFRKLQQ